MLFHTWPFLVFFAIVYPIFLLLRKTPFWGHWLAIASYVFYGWWNPLYLILIVYSTALDYWCVRRMMRTDRRLLWLWVSLVNNLGLLALYKYVGFVCENINYLLLRFDLPYEIEAPDWRLPVGISFFTFQSMSYTIDYYRGNVEAEPSFLRFATFVSFFPQLVAGPIERAKNLLPQLRTAPRISRENLSDGVSLFLTGLFKKVALSNYLAAYADRIFDVPERYDASHLTFAIFAFAWQIYFDFSGYTDMARGVARVMGFNLMLNFRHPYLATGLTDFWSRWHISLSTWFRDYVYIPLGGNRSGTFRTYRNLFLVMLISGFWHGANWTHVIWGAAHGLAAVVMRPIERSTWYDKIPSFFRQLFIFAFVCFCWIFFRAANVTDAWTIITRITSTGWSDPEFPLLLAGLIVLVWIYQWLSESKFSFLVENRWVKIALAIAMVLYLSVAPGQGDKPFIYFQF